MKTPTYNGEIALEQRTERAFQKLHKYLRLVLTENTGKRNHFKCKKWAINAAHVVFEAHPELREEGSLLRYFVAKSGRKQGLSGAALTRYVEAEYANGTWYKHVPADLLAESVKDRTAA